MSLQKKEKKELLKDAIFKTVNSNYIPNQKPVITSMSIPKNLNNTVSPKKVYTPDMINKEADNIFIKNNQTGPLTKYKNRITGMYPKVDQTNENTSYGKEYKRVLDQVTKTRRGMNK